MHDVGDHGTDFDASIICPPPIRRAAKRALRWRLTGGRGPFAQGKESATSRIKDDSFNGAPLEAAAILEGLPDAVVAAARDGMIVFVNALAEVLFGYSRAEVLGRPVQTLWPERVRERYTRNMELYFAEEHPLRFTTEAWGLRRDGSEFVGEMAWGVVRTAAGPLLLAIGRDISERRTEEARLRAVAAIGERALAGDDPVNLAREAVELLPTTLPVVGAEVRQADGSALARIGSAGAVRVRLPIGDGDELLVMAARELTEDEMNLVRAVANTLGTALSHLRDEERIRHEAVHDPLTGLPNRTLLRDRLDRALARSVRDGGATGVLFVDLDNFKQVNDAHGHAAGDAVLVELGRRLQAAIRPTDTVARMGGDEFVVVCEQVDEQSALALGHRLERAIAQPLVLGEVAHRLTASIGIAIGRSDHEALVRRADAALYGAKARGSGSIEVSR
jgi:diguanylate cyclase (GGDEF)-like protein/PAS domain S-box-containing protein